MISVKSDFEGGEGLGNLGTQEKYFSFRPSLFDRILSPSPSSFSFFLLPLCLVFSFCFFISPSSHSNVISLFLCDLNRTSPPAEAYPYVYFSLPSSLILLFSLHQILLPSRFLSQ